MLALCTSNNFNLKNVLILFDGRRRESDVRHLAAKSNISLDDLNTVLQGGYLEQVTGQNENTPLRGISSLAESTKFTLAPFIKPQIDSADMRAYKVLYHFMRVETSELLGIRSFGLQLSIEQATTLEALIGMVMVVSEAVNNQHGFDASMRFIDECANLITQIQCQDNSAKAVMPTAPTAPLARVLKNSMGLEKTLHRP